MPLVVAMGSRLWGARLRAGAVGVVDPLSAPNVQGRREALDRSGATLVDLPPSSPDFNPIEPALAKLNGLLGKAAAGTVSGLESALATALEACAPEECATYFTHAGYLQFDAKML